jgi:hypothetical protein
MKLWTMSIDFDISKDLHDGTTFSSPDLLAVIQIKQHQPVGISRPF